MLDEARRRLFVALDVPNADEARHLVGRLGDSVLCYKIGLELMFGGGLDLARELKARGRVVFLDMKLLDIPATVEKATRNIAALGLDYLTLHGTDTKTIAAAVAGRGAMPLKLLAVTVLTSLERADIEEQGIRDLSPSALVLHRARLAERAGADGVVASGQEAAAVRGEARAGFLIVTPGIRPAGGDKADQARVATPAAAMAEGATHLVVGRPITTAKDPKAAAEEIVRQMAAVV